MTDTNTSGTMTPLEFVAKWSGSTRTERAAAQEHFIDICRLLGVQTPNEADQHGDWYAFEKGAEKSDGGDGFADVWKRMHFAWEYKKKHANLGRAYAQLQQYREALENPPLLVVCDLDRFEVHTNFTNTAKTVHRFTLADLRDEPTEPLRILRAVMSQPEALRPQETPQQITEKAASQFAQIARSLTNRGHEAEAVAHFLNRVLFCLFAEDAGLLPRGLITGLVDSRQRRPTEFAAALKELFGHMAKGGGYFGVQRIEWFNGGLFEDDSVIEMSSAEIGIVRDAAQLDWSQVEPAILGTLFERGLDPGKRSQLGAHYTDPATIARVVEPVVMVPLRREFDAMRQKVEALIDGRTPAPLTRDNLPRQNRPRWELDAEQSFFGYLERLRAVRVLDPACGSGNFLYVTLRMIKDLEKEVIIWGAETLKLTQPFPDMGPHNLLGIDLNPYAAELARVSIWVGHIQWMLDNGFAYARDPILQPLHNIECRDAILAYDDDGNPVPAEWPGAEFIVGNPPFLGDRKMRGGLGDVYVDAVRAAFAGRVPSGADFVCYWHEVARGKIELGHSSRAGLLATKSIRNGLNRRVLKRIKESGDIFAAWSNEPWTVDGAAVRVSIVAQDAGVERERTLNGNTVEVIHADLTGGADSAVDITRAMRLSENEGVAFIGDQKSGPFDISGDVARQLLQLAGNPNGRPNSDVVVPWVNGMDVTRRHRDRFIVDFGIEMSMAEAAMYEAPFEMIRATVQPKRTKYGTETWWIHWNPRPGMRSALHPLNRFICTPRVARHRVFAWFSRPTLPDTRLVAIAREDDYAFGVLHSRVHEVWALRTGGQHGVGNDPQYPPSQAFDTFPFPWPLNKADDTLTPEQHAHVAAIGGAARALNEARERWLNPPDLVREEPDVVPELPLRLVPVSEEAEEVLKTRTLTNLYSTRHTWLANLHRDLDAAVFGAYEWPEASDPDSLDDEEMLRRLLELNLERAAAQ